MIVLRVHLFCQTDWFLYFWKGVGDWRGVTAGSLPYKCLQDWAVEDNHRILSWETWAKMWLALCRRCTLSLRYNSSNGYKIQAVCLCCRSDEQMAAHSSISMTTSELQPENVPSAQHLLEPESEVGSIVRPEHVYPGWDSISGRICSLPRPQMELVRNNPNYLD